RLPAAPARVPRGREHGARAPGRRTADSSAWRDGECACAGRRVRGCRLISPPTLTARRGRCESGRGPAGVSTALGMGRGLRHLPASPHQRRPIPGDVHPMRAVVVSQHYLEPAHRGRLRALAGLGCEVIAGVPERWEVLPGVIARPEWAPDGSGLIAPLPVTGNVDDPTAFQWRGRSLRKLLRETRPDIVEIADAPWTPASARAAADARRLRIPHVAHAGAVPDSLPMGARLRLRRVVRGA